MSNLRVGGLATGMDLESIVKDLMKVEQLKLDKLEQQKTRIQWLQEAYNSINKTFANFILETQKALGLARAGSSGLIKQSVSSLTWVKSATSSNEAVLKAQAKTNAVSGNYTFEVQQLATSWSAASKEVTDDVDLTKLGDEVILQVTVDGTETTISLKPTDSEDMVTVTIGGNSIQVEPKLSAIAEAITKANVGITAQFIVSDAGTGKGYFVMQATKTGSAVNVARSGGDSFFQDIGWQETPGQDAKIVMKVGNNELEFSFSSNQFSLNNIDFTIKDTGTVTVTVDTDVEGVYQKIVDFVNQYNELVDKINSLLTEKVYRDYQPLTKEQKEAMSEKEIELWEEKAKSGLLNRDIYLSRIAQQLRSGLYESVNGKHLTSIGITTERYVAGSMGGKLVIDEYKLKEAIKNDVGSVLDLLFAQPGSETEDSKQRSETGVVNRIYSDLIEGMKQIINKAGHGNDAALYRSVDSRMLLDFVSKYGSISMLQKDMSKLNDRIYVFQQQMLRKENQYWAQFTALEKAINRMNAQAAWLAMQFGGQG
ncbi:MAG TPA: flagellar filament capping protein FliD [Clostridia bacterium]|nr:flagellar filament capping protein FliD [Clostridia bacterium]